MATVGLLMVNVVLVAPEMLLNVPPPFVLSCHCTVGAGVPLAAAVKLTLAAPYVTVWLLGLVVTEGGLQVGVGVGVGVNVAVAVAVAVGVDVAVAVGVGVNVAVGVGVEVAVAVGVGETVE